MDRRTIVRASGVTLSGGLLAGCLGLGDGQGDKYAIEGDENADQLRVSMRGRSGSDPGPRFDPLIVWVTEGGTVIWEAETAGHSSTAFVQDQNVQRRIPHGAQGWNTGVGNTQGAVVANTFNTAGVYDYFCLNHFGEGMVGSVIVGRPTTGDQPGLTDPANLSPAPSEELRAINERQRTAIQSD